MSGLKEYYHSKVKKKLQDTFNYTNTMMIPKLSKIVINMGVAEASKDKGLLQSHVGELGLISGQKPILRKAKQAVSNFKLREGQPIGIKVTLRGEKMYDFLRRFITVVSPRIPDFRGYPTKGDGKGNYTFGLNDQQIFPEIVLDDVKRTQGMNITIVTTATSDKECIELLRLLGMPFKDKPIELVAQ